MNSSIDIDKNNLFLGYYYGVGEVLSLNFTPQPGMLFVNGETNSVWVWDALSRMWIDTNRVDSGLKGMLTDKVGNSPTDYVPNPKRGIKESYFYVAECDDVDENPNAKSKTITFTYFKNGASSVSATLKKTSIVTLFWNGDYWEVSVVPMNVDFSKYAKEDNLIAVKRGSGIKVILTNNDKYINFDTKAQTITIPEEANARVIDYKGTVNPIEACTIDVSGGYCNIFADLKNKTLVSVRYDALNESYWTNDDFVWVGYCYSSELHLEAINLTIDNIPVEYATKTDLDNVKAGNGIKVVLSDKYINFNTKTKTLEIPEEANLRVINNNGSIINLTNAEDISLSGGYCNIYVDTTEKKLISVLYSEENKTYWSNDRYAWIGWSRDKKIHLNVLMLSIDGRVDEYVTKEDLRGSGIKTLITNPGKYINLDTINKKIIIPEDAKLRVINFNGGSTNLNVTEPIDVNGGYCDIFVDSNEKTLVSVLYSNTSRSSYFSDDRYTWVGWCNAGNKKIHLHAMYLSVDGRDVEASKDENLKIITPQIFNTPIPRKDLSESVKIVLFGSSWFSQTWWYLNKITKSAGINADFICFYDSGAPFSRWIDFYNNDTDCKCWTSQNGSDWTETKMTLKDALQRENDIIGFQQGASSSVNWDNWECYKDLVGIVKKCCSPQTTIAFNATWTPPIHSSSYLYGYGNSIEGQYKWQADNDKNIKKFIALSGIYNVAPNGAVIWKMRRDGTINTDDTDLSNDNIHLYHGLPTYATAATFYETFIAPIYGVSIDDVDYLPTESEQRPVISNGTWMPISVAQRDKIRSYIKEALSERFVTDDNPDVDVLSPSNILSNRITWSESFNLNNYKTQGIYYITGERLLSEYDNLPIMNASPGHTISGQLTVLDASLSDAERCVTQYLRLTNRTGSEGKEYVRTYNKYSDGNDGWSVWREIKQTANLNQISDAMLKGYTENGLYEGVINNNDASSAEQLIADINYFLTVLDRGNSAPLPTGTFFTIEVLNNYAVTKYITQITGGDLPKTIIQRAKCVFPTYQYIEIYRTKIGDEDFGAWTKIN